MTELATPERIKVPENTFANKLNQVAQLPPEQIKEYLSMESYEMLLAPEKRLPALVDDLSDIYIDRCNVARMEYRGCMEEVVQFATRDQTDSYLQELYTIINRYGPDNKTWESRSYILDRFELDAPDGKPQHYKICIDPEVEVRTYRFDVDGQMKLLADDDSYRVLGQYTSEALLSASLMADESLAGREDIAIHVRTPEERDIANADAKRKLTVFHEELARAVADIPDMRTDYGQKLLHEHYMRQRDWMK